MILVIVSLDLGFDASFKCNDSLVVGVHLLLELSLLLQDHLFLPEPPVKLLHTSDFLLATLLSRVSSALKAFNDLALLSDLILNDQILFVLLRVKALEQLQHLEHILHVVLQLVLTTDKCLYLKHRIWFSLRRYTPVRGLRQALTQLRFILRAYQNILRSGVIYQLRKIAI